MPPLPSLRRGRRADDASADATKLRQAIRAQVQEVPPYGSPRRCAARDDGCGTDWHGVACRAASSRSVSARRGKQLAMLGGRSPHRHGCAKLDHDKTSKRRPSDMQTITIGLDIAKAVFQVHMENEQGQVVKQRRLRRAQVKPFFKKLPACVIGIEACGSSHYWARVLQGLGHQVRLIPAAYVKPFVRRNKTDARDAAAICTALKQFDMRFVPVKSPEQQASRSLERSRELLVRQHKQLCNSLRSQIAEHGIIAAKGRRGFAALIQLLDSGAARLPESLIAVL